MHMVVRLRLLSPCAFARAFWHLRICRFRCGARRQSFVVEPVRKLRQVFDVVVDICRYGAGRSAYGRRPLFLLFLV